MLLFRRLYSSSNAGALNRMMVIHLVPSNTTKNKFGKHEYLTYTPSFLNQTPNTQPKELFAPSKGSRLYSAHQKTIVSIVEDIGSILKYAETHVRNTEKDPMMVHVSTPEFFFYPQIGGYSQEDIEKIVNEIRNIIVKMKEGVHFNLGTFPLISNQVPLLNTVFDDLYGKGRFIENVTDSFIKYNFYHKIDNFKNRLGEFLSQLKPGEVVDFVGFSKFYLDGKVDTSLVYDVRNIKPFLSNIAICGASGKNSNVNIYSKMRLAEYDPFVNNSTHLKTNDIRLFKSVTLLGDVFYKIYEICLNHDVGMAEKNEALLKLRITPEQYFAFHEIISSSIELKEAHIAAETASHNDTRHDQDRVIVSVGGKKENHKLDREFKRKHLFLFENCKWIKSSLFECEVSVGRLKPLTAPIPSESKNKNTAH